MEIVRQYTTVEDGVTCGVTESIIIDEQSAEQLLQDIADGKLRVESQRAFFKTIKQYAGDE